MKLLILGGTRFLGRHIAEQALARGDTVTLFHRGQSNPVLFPEAEHILGDRDGGLGALSGRQWDAVIDTSGYVPRVVAASAEQLAGAVGQYIFISSISVYPDFPAVPELDESAPVGTLADPTTETVDNDTYGPLKALCEQEVQQRFGEHASIVRPGLIVGPNDPTDRFTYWPHRVARGGEVLAPGRPDYPVQFIDVRDLAAWTLALADHQIGGVYNATGPNWLVTLSDLLETSKAVAGSDATFTWIPDDFVTSHGAEPWMGLPLWVPDAEGAGTGNVNCAKAYAAGLTFHPVAETVRDTLAWDATRPADYQFKAGLTPEKEAEILTAWHQERQ